MAFRPDISLQAGQIQSPLFQLAQGFGQGQQIAGRQQEMAARQQQARVLNAQQKRQTLLAGVNALGEIRGADEAQTLELRRQALPVIAGRLGSDFGINIPPNELAQVDPSDQGLNVFRATLGAKKPQQDLTSLQKNLIAAGVTPGTDEFKQAVMESITKPGTQVTIGGDKKEQEVLAKIRAEDFGKITERADKAIDTIQSLSVLENIDVNTGSLEPAKQALAKFAEGFGFDASGLANVSAGEAFNAEAKRLVLAVKSTQKGPQTDKDEDTIKQTIANLGNTQAGNQFIIDSARALETRKIEQKDFWDQYMQDNDGRLRGVSKAWSDYKRNTPMVSSNLRTPEGLPVFFYKFESEVRNANPDATRGEILEAWRQQDKN